MDDDIAPDVDFDAEAKAFEAGQTVEEAAQEEVAPVIELPKAEPLAAPKQEVPLSALLEERREWKERYQNLETQLKAQAELNARGQERLEKLAQAIQTKNDPQSPPQFEQDPLGNLKHGADTALTEVQNLKQWKEQFEAQQKQQAQFEAFRSTVNSHEQAFAKNHEDYWQAAEHVVKTHREQLELMGVPQEQITQVLSQQLSGIAATALRTGKNPAEVTYELAKRSGFKAGQKQPDIATLAKGVEAAKSVPAGKQDMTLSLESLSNMSDEDFDKLVDDPRSWSKIGRAA